MATEKRNFSSLSFSSKKHLNGDSGSGSGSGSGTHTPTTTKLKNFFRITSGGASQTSIGSDGLPTPKTESKPVKQSRFLPGLGRNRATTIASEGHPLDDAIVSPTAQANPYFVHQGPPALRHRNEGSVPPSPPDTPKVQINGTSPEEKALAAGREELARKLRRVASAPNAQGLFSGSKSSADRPQTAELGKEPLTVLSGSSPKLGMLTSDDAGDASLPDPSAPIPLPGAIRQSVAFRRTYSSNSIKVRNVEVGPGSFDKIKLIGKGDVGKVYLVREKKSNRLYAMKGVSLVAKLGAALLTPRSAQQEGNDQTQQNQESVGRARNTGNKQSSLHRHVVPLVSV